MEIVAFALFFWVLPVIVGHKIGAPKQRLGWVWGLFLGWIGVIIVACLGPGGSDPAPPQLPGPGWYADPSALGMLRYWDGRAWTSNTAPAAAAPPATVQSPGAPA